MLYLTKKSFENAIKVNGAIGGSTNAVIHLAAIAGRMEIDLSLDDWEKCGKEIPTMVNLQPSGKYLMEDFYYAGGLRGLLGRLSDKLHLDALFLHEGTHAAGVRGEGEIVHQHGGGFLREPVFARLCLTISSNLSESDRFAHERQQENAAGAQHRAASRPRAAGDVEGVGGVPAGRVTT